MIRRLLAALALCALLLPGAAALADRDRDPGADPDRVREDQDPASQRGAAFERVTGATRENVPGGKLLVIAYGVVWVTVFGYVIAQWRRQSRVRDDLTRLEKALEEERKPG